MKEVIKIIKEFTDTPGGRYSKDGPNSGEEFREKLLRPKFESLKEGDKLLIDFDGAYGYPTSFLEEVFGGLTRLYGIEEVLMKLEFKSNEEPNIVNEVKEYIKNASHNS